MYEVHITIDPVFGDRRITAERIGKDYGFKLANLLMIKEPTVTEESTTDTFMTGHFMEFPIAEQSARELVFHLNNAGLVVRRYKIEAIIVDSKYQQDPWGAL